MQSLPSLADSVQGFQIIDSNDDNQSAIGVIVALIGDTCIYVPTIYKHGKIYNMDIMYIPEMSQWLPTQDNWVTYLKSRKPELMSVLRTKDAADHGNQPGSVDLDIPFKHLVKSASDETGKQHILRVGLPAVLKEACASLLDELDKPVEEIGIPSAIEVMQKSAAESAAKVLNSIIENASLSNAFVQHYTDEQLMDVADSLMKKTEGGLHGSAKPKTDTGSVKVLTAASTEARGLSDEEKKQLLLKGAVIVDTRGLTPSKVFKAKNTGAWELVNSTGLYELLKTDGNTLTAYVTPVKHYGNVKKAAIIPLDDGMNRVAYIRDLPVGQRYPMDNIPDHCGESVTKFFSTIGVGDEDKYRVTDAIVMTPCGKSMKVYVSGSKPQVIGNVDGTTTIAFHDDACHCDDQQVSRIEILPKGARLRISRGTMYAPEDAIAIKIAAVSGNDDKKLNLSTFEQLQTSVARQEKLLGVKVTNQHYNFSISDDNNRVTEPMDKQAAALDLVRHYAIQPEIAEKIMSEVGCKPVAQERYLVKVANDTGYMLMVNEEQEQAPEEVTIDLNQQLPEDAVQTLIEAGNTGVKEIMDVTVLKTLARDSSTVRQIQELVPKLFSALDAVARILFMIRAGDSMTEAYGTSRSDEMEDQFSQLVASLGDAIICLQQGRVDSVHDLLEGPLASTLG
jgi:hypothetical protein